MMFGFLDWFIVSGLDGFDTRLSNFRICRRRRRKGDWSEMRWRRRKAHEIPAVVRWAWWCLGKQRERVWDADVGSIRKLHQALNFSSKFNPQVVTHPTSPLSSPPPPFHVHDKIPKFISLSSYLRDKRWWRTKFRCCCVFARTATPSHSKELQK